MANEFYDYFVALFKDTASTIFPMLIELLPDDQKRQELLIACHDKKIVLSETTNDLEHDEKQSEKKYARVLIVKKTPTTYRTGISSYAYADWNGQRMNRLRYIMCSECHKSVQMQDMSLHQASYHAITNVDKGTETEMTTLPSTLQKFPELCRDTNNSMKKNKKPIQSIETYHNIVTGLPPTSSLNNHKTHLSNENSKKEPSQSDFPSLPKAPSWREDLVTTLKSFSKQEESLLSSSKDSSSMLKKKEKKVLFRYG